MSRIQFPYRRESTRRQHSSPDNGDFVTGSSHNDSMTSEPAAQAAEAAGPAGTTAGPAPSPALLEALAGGGRAHAGVVHASGGTVAAGVPGATGARRRADAGRPAWILRWRRR